MPSDFKEEYRAYIEADMPDLWGRIEEGIRGETGEEKAAEDASAEKRAAGKTAPDGRKVIPWQRAARRLGQIAAVAAIGLVSVSAVALFMNNRRMSSPAPAASDSAAPAYEAAAPASYDMEEAPAAEEPVMEAAEAPVTAGAAEPAAAETAEPGTDAANGSADKAGSADADGITEEAVLLSLEDYTGENPAYRYVLRFACGDREIACVLSEENAALAGAEGIELQPGGTYRIRIEERGGGEDPDYPYEITGLEAGETE